MRIRIRIGNPALYNLLNKTEWTHVMSNWECVAGGLYQLALDLVESPEEIAWLDLSFNDIQEITDDILE
jgi:hypothetical protein